MSGEISVKSELGKGTASTIVVPLQAVDDAALGTSTTTGSVGNAGMRETQKAMQHPSPALKPHTPTIPFR